MGRGHAKSLIVGNLSDAQRRNQRNIITLGILDNGRPIGLSTALSHIWARANAEAEEDCLLAYLALSVVPLNNDMSTMIAHLHGIGHFHKLKLGPNPITNMPGVQLTASGENGERGQGKKVAAHCSGLGDVESVLGLTTTDHLTVWCVALIGCFFFAQDEGNTCFRKQKSAR